MAKLSFPTSREIKGPLLIDAAQLEVLDQIIDRHLEPMREYRNNTVNEQASKRAREGVSEGWLKEEQAATYEAKRKREFLSLNEFQEGRSVSLYLTKGREIQAHRFSEAVSQPVGDEEVVLGFSSYVRVGEVKAKVQLRASSEEMSIDVEPNDVEVAQEMFGALSNWAGDIEAPKWQQKWLEFRVLPVALLCSVIIVGFIAIPLFNYWAGEGESASLVEARKLLASGINSSNEQRAIALLLAIASHYDPGVPAPPLGATYWSYLLLACVILFISSSCPRVSIGLWKGKRRLKAKRWWIRTVTVAIPTILVSSLLVPWVLHWFRLKPPSP